MAGVSAEGLVTLPVFSFEEMLTGSVLGSFASNLAAVMIMVAMLEG